MNQQEAIWVGVLDLDHPGPVAAVSGPARAEHRQARVLIRLHRAPVGYVWVPVLPVATLTERARSAATSRLADALHRHDRWDAPPAGQAGMPAWAATTGCPRRFSSSGAGVSVIVCTRDRPEGLRDCLRALQRVTHEPLEILVVDNAPTGNETRELVASLAREDPRVRYTSEPRAGLSRARNHGLSHARYGIVAFTDDDTLADEGWPSALAAAFAADPEAACVTGLVLSRELDTGSQRYFDARYAWGEVFEPRRYDLGAHRHPSRLYPFSAGIFGTGANFAVRRDALSPIGEFDPLLGAGGPGRGGEDLDMFLRIILAGGRICYVPSAMVWHRHRADAQALAEQIYSYGHGLGAYLAKHLPDRGLRTALLGHGLRLSGGVLGRMRQATQVSRVGADGGTLAVNEVRGVVAGALCYWRAARREARSSPGAR